MRESQDFYAGLDDEGRRLDRILRRLLPSLGLSRIYQSLRKGRIRVDARKASPADRLAAGACISVDAALVEDRHGPCQPKVPAIPADGGIHATTSKYIILATHDLLFVDKPKGMLIHGEGSLDEIFREKLLGEAAGASLGFIPGPLHRLDRNTSGLVTFSRSARGARLFSETLRKGGLRKAYLAIIQGRLAGGESWEDRLIRNGESRTSRVADPGDGDLEGKIATSQVFPLFSGGGMTFALFLIGTGRTHQIRVQAASHGHPLFGDAKYGGLPREGGYLLHAWRLSFALPPFDDCPAQVEAPLPDELRSLLMPQLGARELEQVLDGARRDMDRLPSHTDTSQ